MKGSQGDRSEASFAYSGAIRSLLAVKSSARAAMDEGKLGESVFLLAGAEREFGRAMALLSFAVDLSEEERARHQDSIDRQGRQIDELLAELRRRVTAREVHQDHAAVAPHEG